MTAYVFSFGVPRDLQGSGVGSRFLELLLGELSGEGVGRIELTVAPSNVRALHLFKEKFGFVLLRSLPSWYGEGEDRFLLARASVPPAGRLWALDSGAAGLKRLLYAGALVGRA